MFCYMLTQLFTSVSVAHFRQCIIVIYNDLYGEKMLDRGVYGLKRRVLLNDIHSSPPYRPPLYSNNHKISVLKA